jgi:hypothetical protein
MYMCIVYQCTPRITLGLSCIHYSCILASKMYFFNYYLLLCFCNHAQVYITYIHVEHVYRVCATHDEYTNTTAEFGNISTTTLPSIPISTTFGTTILAAIICFNTAADGLGGEPNACHTGYALACVASILYSVTIPLVPLAPLAPLANCSLPTIEATATVRFASVVVLLQKLKNTATSSPSEAMVAQADICVLVPLGGGGGAFPPDTAPACFTRPASLDFNKQGWVTNVQYEHLMLV